MKRNATYLLFTLCGLIAIPSLSQAQLLKRLQKNLEKQIENKAENVVDNLLNGKEEEPAGESTAQDAKPGKLPAVSAVYDFVPGREVIFEDNMAKDTPGRMPKHWKTHSTGAVASVEGVAGKWLRVEQNASYQLDKLIQLPERFTLEFDILTRSAEASDLRNVIFGFSKNPTPKSYIYGVSADQTVVSTALKFYYNTVNTSSNDTGVRNRVDFPLENLGNARIPVAVEVDGTHIRVFVNRRSVMDTEALTLESPKYFFFSNDECNGGAQVYIGNLRIAR